MKMPEEENLKLLSLLWHSPAPSTFSILYGYQRIGINKEANGNPFPRQKSDLFQDSAAMSGVPPANITRGKERVLIYAVCI
jgi:hypothetical protein